MKVVGYMSRSNQAIPAVDAHLEATYERIPAMREHVCDIAVAGQVRIGNTVDNIVQGGRGSCQLDTKRCQRPESHDVLPLPSNRQKH